MSLHAERAAFIVDERDTAQPAVIPAFFDANFNLRLSGDVHPDDTVRLVPVRNPIIDERKDVDALDPVEEAAVDAIGFASGDGAGAIVARQFNPWLLIVITATPAERLDDTLIPVLHLAKHT